MALKKSIMYQDPITQEQVETTYHILASLFIDRKAPNENGSWNVSALIQSYRNKQEREVALHETLFRQMINLAGHQTETNLSWDNSPKTTEEIWQQAYDILKSTKLFEGCEDC